METQEIIKLGKNLHSSEIFSLKDLFNGNYFKIPDYQRGYSWEEAQIRDLIEDIENISKLDHAHYTGTIVAAKSEGNNRYDIVDGQQRLTTLIIFLSEIYYLDPKKYTELRELFMLRGDIGNEQRVFEPNLETKVCFDEVILNNKKTFNPSIKSHFALMEAKSICNAWLSSDLSKLDDIYDTITKQLSFLFFTPKKDKEIGIMFEVINNRGKALSELEKVKNYFIYYATVHDKLSLKDNINEKWTSIQINLSQAHRTSNEDENAFLRNCYLVFFKASKDKSWNVYDESKKEFDVRNADDEFVLNSVIKMQKFVNFLSTASSHYAWFYNQEYYRSHYHGDLKAELDKALTYLRCQPVNASIMPLYLSIMSRFGDEPEKCLNLLNLLEVVNMRLYVMPDVFRRADSKQGDMFWFANEFFNDSEWNSTDDPQSTTYNEVEIVGDVFDWLFHNLLQITYAFCPQERLIDNLHLSFEEDYDFYRWNGLRYFLACYEEQSKNKKAKRSFDIQRILSGKKNVGDNNNDQLSIEHIWASKNRENDFSPKFHTKRRLGNFVLCGLSSNISLSNHDISDKVSDLMEFNSNGLGALDMYQVHELDKILKAATEEAYTHHKKQTKNYFGNLGKFVCRNREEKLISFALDRWKLPFEKKANPESYRPQIGA